MSKLKINISVRVFFAFLAGVILAGIGLTGFNSVHWLLYVPLAILVFAAVTGICPGLFIARMVTKS